jgi:RNA 2',3'-cyclic 3'-phosphodiesterase
VARRQGDPRRPPSDDLGRANQRGPTLARLFYALPLTDPAIARVSTLVGPLRVAFPRARWAVPGSYHLTLLFLGDVPVEAEPELRAALLGAAASVEAFECRLEHGGGFEGGRRERVVWLGIDEGAARQSATLAGILRAQLARSSTAAVRGAVAAAARVPFRAHLTICRRAQPELEGRLARELAARPRIRWQVASLELLSSRLTGAGPDHTVLARAPLGREPTALASGGRRGTSGDDDHDPEAEAMRSP